MANSWCHFILLRSYQFASTIRRSRSRRTDPDRAKSGPVLSSTAEEYAFNPAGGWGSGLEQAIEKYQNAEPGRCIVFTTLAWKWSDQPGYAQFQVEQIERAHCAGAHGLKVEKILGLYLRENIGGRIELCSELKPYRTQKPRSSNYSGTNSIKFIIDFWRHNPSTLVMLLRLLHRRALVYLRTWIAGRHFAQDVFRECRAAHKN
jgi:hypothetical protein